MHIDPKINSKQLREMLGGISDMSLWRFVHSSYLNFPKPTYINKRRFWNSSEIEAWFKQQPSYRGGRQ